MADWKQLLESAVNIQTELGNDVPSTAGNRAHGGSVNLNDINFDSIRLFDVLVTDPDLARWTRRLFRDGHFARAVEEAFKCLNNIVKNKSRSMTDGAPLMQHAFSADKPILKLNRLKSQSERDEQRGYMEMFAGAMRGIRNPRAHDHELEDHPEAALELLTIANHLIVRAKAATRARQVRRLRNL